MGSNRVDSNYHNYSRHCQRRCSCTNSAQGNNQTLTNFITLHWLSDQASKAGVWVNLIAMQLCILVTKHRIQTCSAPPCSSVIFPTTPSVHDLWSQCTTPFSWWPFVMSDLYIWATECWSGSADHFISKMVWCLRHTRWKTFAVKWAQEPSDRPCDHEVLLARRNQLIYQESCKLLYWVCDLLPFVRHISQQDKVCGKKTCCKQREIAASDTIPRTQISEQLTINKKP